MTSIVFKAKVKQMYSHDDTPLYMFVELPKTIKKEHIVDGQKHRMFSGKVSPDIINIRAKKILSDLGIYQLNLSELPDCVSIKGEYMVTVSISI